METVETIRKNYAKQFKRLLYTSLIILAVIIAVTTGAIILLREKTVLNVSSCISLGFFIFIVPFSILAIVFYRKTEDQKTKYKKAYKAYYVGATLEKIFTDIHYDHEKGMPISAPESTGIIRTGNSYKSNDLVIGKYKGTEFMQADVEIARETEDTSHKIFKGRWMTFTFPKPFLHRLAVVDKKYYRRIIPVVSADENSGFRKIETESQTFNKKFITYAEDGFEAYYLLDPAFIEQTENLSNIHKGKILLVFSGDMLHVAIDDNNDAFEPPSILKPIDEQKEIEKIMNEIKIITNFVDYLKLNRKMFKTK